jgi:predicted outer membrane lipoprotein
LLDTPQILIREEDQAALAKLGKTLHFDAAQLLDQAREGLISGVHHAWLACALIICFAIILALRLPHFELHAQDKSHITK